MRRLFVLLLVLTLVPAAFAADALTNADVVQLVTAKLAPRVIVQAIASAPTVAFSLTPKDLIALKSQGVPDDVLAAMLTRTSTPSSTASTTAAPAIPSRVVTVRIARGSGEWALWSRAAGETAAVGVLFVPDATFSTTEEARAVLEAYNTKEQGTLVVGGGRDTLSFYSMDCYRYRADACNKWDRVQFSGATWEPPAQVSVPVSPTTSTLGAIAVIRYGDGKLRLLEDYDWLQNSRDVFGASCFSHPWAVGRVHTGGVTLTAHMEIDYKRPLGMVTAMSICPQLVFN